MESDTQAAAGGAVCGARANRQLTSDGRHRAGAGSMRLAARYHHLPANPFIRRIGAGVRCDEKQD